MTGDRPPGAGSLARLDVRSRPRLDASAAGSRTRGRRRPGFRAAGRTDRTDATAAHRCRGFTLLEVLVALAITAVALGAGLRAAGVLTDNAGRLADVSAAQWCADNHVTGLRLARQLPGVGDADFACEELGRSYRGQLRTRTTQNPNFRRVDAIVSSDTGVQLVTLSTVLSRY